MDTTMLQLRSFVHQRLYTAAEEILGEVQKTITLAMYEAEVSRSKEEVKSLRNELDLLRNKSAAEPSLSSSTGQRGDAPLLQENPGPSTPEESNSSLGAEVPGASQTSAEPDHNTVNHRLVQTDFLLSTIKEEQEELGGDGQTQEMVFPPPEIVKTAEPSLSSSTGQRGDAPLLQENPGPSTPEESNSSLGAEVPGASQTSAEPYHNTLNHRLVQTDFLLSTIKEEQEELGGDGQTQEMVFPPPEIVKSEKDQPEIQASYEMQPVSSDVSAAESENRDSDEELVNSKGEQTETMKQKGKILQGQSGSANEKDKGALQNDKSPAKSEKGRSFCHFCGKGFKNIGSLMKHIKAHEKNFDCTVCGVTCLSSNELITHVKDCHNKTYFCDICGKTFDNSRCLRVHKRLHTDKKEFVCQGCGKTFDQIEHLTVHMRTHSWVKPYQCDFCGKEFSESQNLKIHKRSHSGVKRYQCGECGSLFSATGQLKKHMRYHSEDKLFPCDICGKRFTQSGEMTRHKTTHTEERPYFCRICGMRYRCAPNLKMHLQTHEKVPYWVNTGT